MTYEFLIEMGWKSALIAAAALALAFALRSRSAADRGAVLKVAVALLLALPAIALFAPAFEIVTAAPAPATAVAAPEALPAPLAGTAPEALASAPTAAAPGASWDDPSLLFFLLYVGGALMVGGRLLAGLWTLSRWTRAAREADSPEWKAALSRAGGEALGVRLLVSEDAASPLSWGWRRPVVLIDRDTYRQAGEADAILAHELAHVARRDWPSLIMSRAAVALFWFNPLVWRLDREVAQQAEEAADSHATETVEPTRYAQTLLDWARHDAGPLPANAIAAGEPGLSKRVRAILDGRVSRRPSAAWAGVAMLACVAVAAPVAAIEFVEAAPDAPRVRIAAPALLAPPAPGAPAAPPAPAVAAPGAPAVPAPAATPPAPPAPAPLVAAAVHAQARAHAAAHVANGMVHRPHIDGDAIGAQVEAAVAQAMKAVEAASAQAEAQAEHAVEAALASVAHGAIGMEAGAKGMEQGARNMRSEAARLRNRDYREAQIRKAAARGEHVTHEELLEAAKGLDEGAEGMKEGAREMREAAAEMRREARRR